MKRCVVLFSPRTILQGRGIGIFGALGTGTYDDKYCFHEINIGNKQPLAVASGIGHTAVITNDHRIAIFGRPFDLKSTFRVYRLYRIFPILAIWATKLTLMDESAAREIVLSPLFLDDLMKQKVVSVSCSGGFTIMLTETGKVYCLGSNNYGQCGIGDSTRMRLWRPIANVSLPIITAIDSGLQHCIALSEHGEVFCWGKGKNGQMGSGDTQEINAHPRLVPINRKCVAVAAGLNHSVALDESGVLHIWGKRMSEQLVEGTKHTYTDQLEPREITLPNGLKIIDVSCSTFTTVVSASDGSLWIMGLDELNNTVSMSFQQVLNPLNYESGQNLTEDELSKQKEAQEPFRLVGGERLKKGYFSVALISSCSQKVYDVTLKNGVARLHEIGMDFRKEGKIKDFSMGYRHCMVITETSDESQTDSNN